MSGTIVRPPRAFQLVLTFAFPEETRTDAELQQFILGSVGVSLAIGVYARGAGLVQIPATAELFTPAQKPRSAQ